MSKWEWLPVTTLIIYLLGWFLSWTHAISWTIHHQTDEGLWPVAILFGWVWGLFWPLQVAVVLWLNFWF